MLGAVRLIHVFPSMTVTAGSALLAVVAHGGVPTADLWARVVVVVAASQVAVGALNDYIDRHDDARVQPDKPLPSGEVGPAVTLTLVGVGIVVTCTTALSFGLASLVIASVGLGSGVAYDLWLKRTPLSALCYVVSFLSLLTWIWLVAGSFTTVMIWAYPLGACLMIAAHLANALPDAATDASLGQHGLAVVLGPRRSLMVVLASSCGGAIFALCLSVILHVLLGTALALLGLIPVAIAARVARRKNLERHDFQTIFRCVAPSMVLVGASCLLAFSSVA